MLTWDEPADPGGSSVDYEVLRSVNPRSFTVVATCISDLDPSDTTVTDPDLPPFLLYAYLVRATNACPAGIGTLGTNSDDVTRLGVTCP